MMFMIIIAYIAQFLIVSILSRNVFYLNRVYINAHRVCKLEQFYVKMETSSSNNQESQQCIDLTEDSEDEGATTKVCLPSTQT